MVELLELSFFAWICGVVDRGNSRFFFFFFSGKLREVILRYVEIVNLVVEFKK